MNRKYAKVGFIVAMVTAMYFFSQFYLESYRSASEEFQNLQYAIMASAIGIFLHFFKNYSKIKDKKNLKMTFESLELLMLVTSPVLVSFKILKDLFPNNPDPIILLSTLAIFSWYVVTIFRTSRPKDADVGKEAFSMTIMLYTAFLAVIGMAVWIVILFR